MTHFLIIPKAKPEFKIAQPLPALSLPAAGRYVAAAAPEAVVVGLRLEEFLNLLTPAQADSIAARNLTA